MSTIDGDRILGATIDGTLARQATIDGEIAYTLIDSFEDGDIAEYSGDTADYAVTSEANVPPSAVFGANVLECTTTASVTIYSTTGLSYYFPKGHIASAFVYLPSGSGDVTVLFGVSSATSWYGFEVDLANGELALEVDDTPVDSVAVTVPADQWIECEITWDDGSLGGVDNDITCTAYDYSTSTGRGASIGTVAANDSTHATDTGIGLNADTSGILMDHYMRDSLP